MLKNLNFIREGEAWPPASEVDRISRYEANNQLFNGEHAIVYAEQLKRINRVLDDYTTASYPVVSNYQRLISLKTADLLIGEPPEFSGEDEKDEEQAQRLKTKLDSINFQTVLYQAAIDISRYGEGILQVYRDEGEKSCVSVGRPDIWFPVVDPANIKRIIYQVLGWVEEVSKDDKKLHIQIHERGRYTESIYQIDGGKIGACLASSSSRLTGLPGFAVFVLQGTVTSDSIYGHDDYTDVDSIISEIMVRVGQISRILDKHASPTMQGPESMLTEDDNGGYHTAPGNYIVVPPAVAGESNIPVSYVTWDGQLSSAFEQLNKLHEELYAVSQLGGALLGNPDHMGGTESGRALRLRMINPLAKVARIAANITPVLKEVVAALLYLDGDQSVTPESLRIQWYDGLPNDPLEDAQLIQIENGNKPVISHHRSIMQANDMTNSQAEEELERIRDETAESMPAVSADYEELPDDEDDETDNET